MSDMLSSFPGTYAQKVEALMKALRNETKNIPLNAEPNLKFNNEKELLEHYDFSTAGLNRRIQATVNFVEKARTELSSCYDRQTIDGNFAFGNSMMMRGGYNSCDHNHFISLASAIWILDQLSLQGNIDEIYQYLPDPWDGKPCTPYVAHPEYDINLITALTKLLIYRNQPDYQGLDPHQGTLFSKHGKNKRTKEQEIRKNFNAVMDLLDTTAIQNAVATYEQYVWDFYRVSFAAIVPLQQEEDRLQKELEELNDQIDLPNQMTKQKVPFVLLNPQSNFDLLRPKADNIAAKQRALELQLNALAQSSYFTEFSLPNSREKVAKKFASIIGSKQVQKLIDFSVDDPFEMAFALFYLLDTDSDIPWLYYGSISVAYTLLDQLPFDTAYSTPGKMTSLSNLNQTLYRHKYQGYRWDDATDCFYEPVKRDRAKNLSQIIYANTYTIFPRVAYSIPNFDTMIESLDLQSDEEKNAYRMMLHLLTAQNTHNESMLTYRLRTEDFAEDPESPEDDEQTIPNGEISKLQVLLQSTRKENSNLRTALHEEDLLKRAALRNGRALERENERMRRELADLRDLIFLLESHTEEDTMLVKNELAFPVSTKKKIASFGGHASWLHEIKKMLPDVAFYSPEVLPNADVLKNVDEVWIQTNCISHGAFYRIVSILKGYDVQLHYFKYASARKCAEQLISANINP